VRYLTPKFRTPPDRRGLYGTITAEEPMVCTTLRWRELDSKFQFGATLGSLTGLRDTRSGQSIVICEIMLFLHSNGVGTSRAMRIYKTYGADAIRLISENPYRLARDIRGIGFRTADQIAAKLGIEKRARVIADSQRIVSSSPCARHERATAVAGSASPRMRPKRWRRHLPSGRRSG